jgi:hypothetical protein
MRCPHCDNVIDDRSETCPVCNKGVRPVPRRTAERPAQTADRAPQSASGSPLALPKRCPFCAEEILEAAIVCKHCRRDIGTRTDLPFAPIPGATATSGLLYFWAALTVIVLCVLTIGGFGVFLVVAISSIWAASDASTHRLAHYRQNIGGPATVGVGSLLLWIVVFPWYLAVRSRIRAGVQPVKE